MSAFAPLVGAKRTSIFHAQPNAGSSARDHATLPDQFAEGEIMEYRRGANWSHSALMFAAFMIGHHFSISAF
jgi:hypothetical protein